MGDIFRALNRLAIAPLLCCGLLFAAARGAPPVKDSEPRPYRDGPLTAEDYRQPAPDPRPVKDGIRLTATTWTSVHYNTTHEWHDVKKNTYVAKLTGIEITASVESDKSWLSKSEDEKLLDHEQGHFDIAEITARRAQRKFKQLLAGDGLTGHGRDQASAVADLNRQVQALMQGFFDAEEQEQMAYDRVTHHGTVPATQAEQRNKQRAELHDLAEAKPR